MVNPFTIVLTVKNEHGTGITVRAAKAKIIDGKKIESAVRVFVLVPNGEDVDNFVYLYLKNAGWVE